MLCTYMHPLVYIVILASFSVNSAESTDNICGIVENVYQRLDWAEIMIKSAKEKISINLEASLPLDCEDHLNNGEAKSGIYSVWPKNRIASGSISVYCDMETDGGGWTVIQRRGDFSHEEDYFYKDWDAYKKGFGNLKEDFWLGNDNIYAMSNQKQYSLRIDLGDFEGNKAHALYSRFWIDDEYYNYTLHAAEYSGTAGDSFSKHSTWQFSTRDRDNDKSKSNCADYYNGAWWFKTCFFSHLNGKYKRGKSSAEWQGIVWEKWLGSNTSLATTEMKIRKAVPWNK